MNEQRKYDDEAQIAIPRPVYKSIQEAIEQQTDKAYWMAIKQMRLFYGYPGVIRINQYHKNLCKMVDEFLSLAGKNRNKELIELWAEKFEEEANKMRVFVKNMKTKKSAT
jgi:hypothetical protein